MPDLEKMHVLSLSRSYNIPHYKKSLKKVLEICESKLPAWKQDEVLTGDEKKE